MKTLAQVEPRTPISSAPYTISQPGAYYLTTNLTSVGHGIIIQADRVTLDLMGFSLTGSEGINTYGIWMAGTTNLAVCDVVVRGGMVRSFWNGLRFDSAQNSRAEGVAVSSNSSVGIVLAGTKFKCDGNTIADCAVRWNVGYGIHFDGTAGSCNGNTIRNSTINWNLFTGIYFYSGSGVCNGNTIVGCTVGSNSAYGVQLDVSTGRCSGNTIQNSTVVGNRVFGIYLQGHGGRCEGNMLQACAVIGNGSNGVFFSGNSGQCNGNTLRDCSIVGNNAYGVHLYGRLGQCDGNLISDNVLWNNQDYGIYCSYAGGNRIENNHVSQTAGLTSSGISTVSSSNNFIFKNTCVGQINNFSISANDTYGPIVTSSGALVTTNGAAALSPWANFSR
jgi:parallel beta-helix repeat protein